MRMLVVDGRIIDTLNHIDAVGDVFIEEGRIAQRSNQNGPFDRTINASGLIVCPGLVDLQVRLREPGQEHKATMPSELGAAGWAVVTSVCCPPDSDPVTDIPAMVHMVRQLALIHISEPTRRYAILYAVFCSKKKSTLWTNRTVTCVPFAWT